MARSRFSAAILSLALLGCANHAQREEHWQELSALTALEPVPTPTPSATPAKVRDSELLRGLEDLKPVRPIEKPSPSATPAPLHGIQWTSKPKPSVQIQAKKGAPLSAYSGDFSFSGDLSNAQTFFKTHEVIFWLKGSFDF
jgi:hypothetical protein